MPVFPCFCHTEEHVLAVPLYIPGFFTGNFTQPNNMQSPSGMGGNPFGLPQQQQQQNGYQSSNMAMSFNNAQQMGPKSNMSPVGGQQQQGGFDADFGVFGQPQQQGESFQKLDSIVVMWFFL